MTNDTNTTAAQPLDLDTAATLSAEQLDELAQRAGFIINPVGQIVVPAPYCDARGYLTNFYDLIAQASTAQGFSEADIPADAPRAFAKRYSALLEENAKLKAQAGAADTTVCASIDSRATQPVQAGEAVDREWVQRTWMECNQDLFAFTQAVQRRATLAPMQTEDKIKPAMTVTNTESTVHGCDWDSVEPGTYYVYAAPVAAQQAAAKAPAAQAVTAMEKFITWANDNGFKTALRDDPASPDTFFYYETEQRWIVWQAASPASTPEASQQASAVAAPSDWKPGQWFEARTLDEMQAFYLSRLPAIREAAKAHGYAVGLHGSQRRDFDLMAMQWRDDASPIDTLAHAIAEAACGITRDGTYAWEAKPNGRFAVSIPICWTDYANPEFVDKPSLGHIDLSVIDSSWMIRFIDKRAEDYLQDHALTDPDTGAVLFNRGEAGREYHSTLVELADDIRAALAAQQAQASAMGEGGDA